MQISIVTLNYNGSKETLELLKSLKDQTDSDFETIVVDNASEEADFSNLQAAISKFNFYISTVENDENLGFSGGNNVGICQALRNEADWVVFLNNDTWVEESFIERLKVILSAGTGVIGIPLIEGDKTAYCGKIQWLKPTLIHLTMFNIVNPQIYAIGGAMAVHKDVFEKIGLLNEKYFLYFEDADFSLQARKAGFDVSTVENLSIHHHVSSSTKKLGSPLLMRYHYRNALYFNLKNGPWYIKLLVWPWSWIIAIKQVGKLTVNKNREGSRAILAGVTDFYKNKMGKINTGAEASRS